MTTLRSGSATHVGQVRSLNEDSFLVRSDADLFGVADGMGGHNGGEIASAMAVEFLEEHAGEPTLENLKQAARLGNRAIFEKAGNDADLHGMGTTLCAVRVRRSYRRWSSPSQSAVTCSAAVIGLQPVRWVAPRSSRQ